MGHTVQNQTLKFWRNILLVNAFIGYSIYYISRKSITFSIPILQEDVSLSITTETFGIMSSAHMAAYSVGKITCGILSDKYSTKSVFSSGLFVIGLINIAFGYSHTSTHFIILQTLNGFFQGCGWAPIAILIKRWYPPTEIGTIWAILSATMNISSSFIPLLLACLSDSFHWRSCFIMIGSAPCCFALISYMLITDHPDELKTNNDAMKNIKNVQQNTNKEQVYNEEPDLNYSNLFFSKFFWLISLSYLIWSFVKSGLEDWLQLYFINERNLDKYQVSWMLMYFQFGGLFACICSGMISDKLMEKYGKRMRSSPRIPIALFCSSTILLWLYLLHFNNTNNVILVNVICFSVGLCCYGPHTLYGLLILENAPNKLSGTAHAISSSLSTIGSVMAGYPLSYLNKTHGWNSVFLTIAVVATINTLLLLLATRIDRRMVKDKTD